MLVQLSIRNLAIVDTLDLELGPGATALTGETGAGKSILVDALGLAAGSRASSAAVRPGCERSEVSAVFEVGGNPAVLDRLGNLEIDDPEGQCVLRRIVSADGRSRAFVNGTPVSVGTLREFGELLVDIHGQHAHHALLRLDEQRRLLDEYARHAELLAETATLHREWMQVCEAIASDPTAGDDPDARLDYLRYQLNELEALELTVEGLEKLNEEHSRLAHVGELQEATEEAILALDDDEGVSACNKLLLALRAITRIESYDGAVSGAKGLLEEAEINLGEALNQLKAYRQGLDADPQALQTLERRLASIHDAARKHRVEPEALPALCVQLLAEAQTLENSGERLAALREARDELLRQYRQAARRLSEARASAASRLAREVTANMQRLGMTGARFQVEVTPDEARAPASAGTDRIEFCVAANPGLPMQPVARTASGGELSRISLAIQVVDVSTTGVPTVIFDEVDVGVGGRHGEVVGKMLHALSEHRQVLCVTHLPQVASSTHHHIRILKTATADTTKRMLGGIEVTRQTMAHAREMLARA
jgi:DNA repair protein RecN (Recombination protein N)